MKKRRAKAKLPKLPSAWVITKRVVADYLAHWKGYLLVLAVVAVPVNLLSLVNIETAAASFSAYLSFATVIMNVAFIYALTRTQASGETPTVRRSYYDGSSALVRFLLVSLAMLAYLTPFAFGLAVWALALNAADYYGGYGPETVLLGLLAAVLALPSLYLLVRYLFAPVTVVREGLWPIAALKKSRAVGLGRFWPIVGRLLLMIVFLVVVLVPSLLILWGFYALHQPLLGFVIFQMITTFTVLPLLDIYIFQLYLACEEAPAAEPVEEAATESESPAA